MKQLAIIALMAFANQFAFAQSTDTLLLQSVEISAVRAADKTPLAKQTLKKDDIEKQNIGQDLPFLLNQTPSLLASSDAGNGVGYTYMRLRGSDASRINITLNGIPFNDAESQGTFFVDMPDIASSASSIQIQRGVGTSTNGAGAFAGSINISTNEVVKNRNIEFNNTYGSYNTHKHSLIYNSGIFKKHFLVDARLSSINSDGYMDRAWSKLLSGYFSTAYVDNKNAVRFNIIHGKEKTYQAWNGVAANTLKTDRSYNSAGTEKPGEPYKNEFDKYDQTHYQLFFNHQYNQFWKSNLTIFLTRGKGYYEQYKADRTLADYGLQPIINGLDTLEKSDLVRRLWLDNYFYGTIISAQYDNNKTQLVFGSGINFYDGKHYGTVVNTIPSSTIPKGLKYYNLPADKNDAYFYAKWSENIATNWTSFVDVQIRNVDYTIKGFRNNPSISINKKYTFLNPKAGMAFNKNNNRFYLSYARANKEPNRDDFEAGLSEIPKPETLNDFEMGWERKTNKYAASANIFYMLYQNQLALTGKINDVGAYTRNNIKNSYRTGIELMAAGKFNEKISASANLTLSKNKIKNFTEFIDEYDADWNYVGQKTNAYKEADLALSPNVMGAATIDIKPVKAFEINLFSKFVGKQFLDNTSNNARKIDAYFVQDARLGYEFKSNIIKQGKAFVQCNNIFNKKYVANGYTFSYYADANLTTENYYFPMATFNWMVGVNLKF